MATPVRIGAIAGEYMEAVLVVEWHAAVGDRLEAGQRLLTVETAKAATEVPSPCGGVLTAINAAAGEEVPVETVLGLIGAAAGDVALGIPGEGPASPPASSPSARSAARPGPAPRSSARIAASPYARKQAARLGVALEDLRPTSPSGRLKARDVQDAARTGARPSTPPGPLAIQRLREGRGVPVVALHGFTADANAWRPLARQLADGMLLAIELSAHGSSPRAVPPDFAALAGLVVTAFDALGLERAHLIGHSLGGAVALALADARPRAIASLALIAPAGLGPELAGDCLAGVVRASGPASLGPWLRTMVGDPALVTDDFVRAAMSLRADAGLRAAQATMAQRLFPDGTQGFDLRPALGRLAGPARILWGKSDAVIPWRHATCAPGHVGLHLLQGIGHLPHIEAPALVARIVGELQRGGGAR